MNLNRTGKAARSRAFAPALMGMLAALGTMALDWQSNAQERPDIVWETLGYDDFIGALAFFPDGTQLVTGGKDGLIKIWNTSDGTHVRTLEGHTSYIYDVSVSNDGKMIASAGGGDKSVRIWDAQDGRMIRVINQPSAAYRASFSPTGEFLVIDPPHEIHRTDDGTLVRTLDRGRLSPDGLWRSSFSSPTAFWKNSGGTYWDSTNEVLRFSLPYQSGVVFSPDSSLVLATIAPKTQDDEMGSLLKLIDLNTGTEIRTFTFPPRGDPKNPINWIDGRAFSPDLQVVGAISASTHVFDPGPYVYITIWKASDGSVLKFYRDTAGRTAWGGTPFIFSPDGQFFAYTLGEGKIVLARTPGVLKLQIIQAEQQLILSWPASVSDAQLESTDQLDPGAVWTDVSTPPVVIGDAQVVTVDIVPGPQFFRLRTP